MIRAYDEYGNVVDLVEREEWIRQDERKKVLDEVYRVITNQMIKHGTELDFNLETQELMLKMKGEQTNEL